MAGSSTEALRAAATGSATAKKEPQTFPQMLLAYKDQIAAALPKHITPDRMARIALTAFRTTRNLDKCEPRDVFAAIIMSSTLGLEIGIQGQAYLVPYKNNRTNKYVCQFIPGWKGLVDLAQRSGRSTVWTGAVYKGDEFEYAYGTQPEIHHKPGEGLDEPENMTHTYAVGWVKGAQYPIIEVWPVAKLLRHRDRYNKVGDDHYSHTHPEMYARKIPLLQVLKYMPSSVELNTALTLDQSAEGGGQTIDLAQAIDGSFAAAAGEDSAAEKPGAPTKEQAIGLLTASAALPDLTAAWTSLKERYAAAGEAVPVEVDGKYNDRRAALEQKA